MLKRRLIPGLLVPAVLLFVPTPALMAQGPNCGPFTDVPASNVFCPFILQAFITSVTQGTSATTFSPSDLVPRQQMVTFFDRGMDLTLHRGTVRTAIGKTWTPTSPGSGIGTDAGAAINDIVTDGANLWIARDDGKILKVNLADRRLIETWTIPSGVPEKLGVFAGLVWIADNLGHLYNFNPTDNPGVAVLRLTEQDLAANSPSLSFDGANIWWGSPSSTLLFVKPSLAGAPIPLGVSPGNVDGLVFDGTYMWVLLSNSTIEKFTIPTASAPIPRRVETLTFPAAVTPCRMVYDGNNIWIPTNNGTLYVVRPTTNLAAVPSTIAANMSVPDVASPSVASFDGENVMIGGLENGTVALYKATSLSLLQTFATGASSVRGIASDGKTFNVGDYLGTKFYQF